MSATVQEFSDLFIGGEWVPASSDGMLDVISPATGEVIARVPEPNTGSRAPSKPRTPTLRAEWPAKSSRARSRSTAPACR
jgi:acyl-CoA reductase-like NAD-dependent aldehyde dehydrogenase